MLPNRWVIFWDNQPVGLDSNSGGYPFKTDEPSLVKYWRSLSEAEDYMKHWPRRIWTVREIQFRILNKQGD